MQAAGYGGHCPYRAGGSIGLRFPPEPAALRPSLPASPWGRGRPPCPPMGCRGAFRGPASTGGLWGPAWAPPPSVRPSLRARSAGANGSCSWFCRGRGGPGRLRLEQLVSSFLPDGPTVASGFASRPAHVSAARPEPYPNPASCPRRGSPRHSLGYKRLRTIPRERSPGWKPSKPGSACVVIFFFFPFPSLCLRHLKRGEKNKKKKEEKQITKINVFILTGGGFFPFDRPRRMQKGPSGAEQLSSPEPKRLLFSLF